MLSPEDSLRLNVLLKQDLQALRIDEGKMTVYALTGRGEARIPLNPNCPEETYLRRVRETISSNVLGVPHGYPAYLKRWTRMGHAR
ncbi:MAG TPA: DsrS, partial [Thioalkalivibrio sp.]|nr:DsrS [Thioalkalivibrio sp.]